MAPTRVSTVIISQEDLLLTLCSYVDAHWVCGPELFAAV